MKCPITLERFQDYQEKLDDLTKRYQKAVDAETELMSGKQKIKEDLITCDALLQYRIELTKQISKLKKQNG